MTRTFFVNGETREWRGQSVREILAAAGVAPGNGGVAVALNSEVVPRGDWDETRIEPDDGVEIVHIVRGG